MKTIKIKGEVNQTCTVFPSIYEFKDEEGNEYYFRYRGYMLTLNKNDEIVFTYHNENTDDIGGFMSWEECCLIYYSKEEVFINDTEVTNEDHTWWLDSDLMNEMFRGLEGESV